MNENSFLQHLRLSHFFALTVAFLGPIAPLCWLPSANLVCGTLCLTCQTDAADVDHIANSTASIPYSFLWLFGRPIEHIPSIMATGPCLLVPLSKLLPGTSSAFFRFSHSPGNYRAIYGPQEPYTSSSIPPLLP